MWPSVSEAPSHNPQLSINHFQEVMSVSAFFAPFTALVAAMVAKASTPSPLPELEVRSWKDCEPGGRSNRIEFWVVLAILSSLWAVAATILWLRLRRQVFNKVKMRTEEELRKARELEVNFERPSPWLGAVGRIWLV